MSWMRRAEDDMPDMSGSNLKRDWLLLVVQTAQALHSAVDLDYWAPPLHWSGKVSQVDLCQLLDSDMLSVGLCSELLADP